MSVIRFSLSLALAGLLGACMAPGAGPATPGAEGDFAPAVPVDQRSHGYFEQVTGINGDAVSALSGDAGRSYIYFDFFAANKAAVAAAPAKVCAGYGRGLKASRMTLPADREPGIKVLVVDCAS